MIQRKFLCKDLNSAMDAVRQIGNILTETPHKSALITFHEKGFTKEDIDILISAIKESSGDIKIAGISATLIAEMMPEGTGINLNLILTNETDIEVVAIPCLPGGETEAAKKLRARLDDFDNVKAVELFGSNMAINTTRFMEKAMEGHENAVLFGTTTIRNLTQKVSVEESEIIIEEEKTDEDLEKDEFVAGDHILNDGFVAVIFAGEKLKVQAEYALGWNPIGRKLPVELGKNPLRGETVVNTIKGMPAVDIYREYLGVYPDAYLISNICEFPLVVERDGIDICLIPLDGGKDGELYFMMTLHEGEQLRFTFASHDEVLYASRSSLEKMEKFQPEALFLTLCGNRINFLKEDAHIEWDEFSSISPDHALMHGACELYYRNKRGGILNSAHLSIGLKECEEIKGVAGYEHPTLESLRHGRTLSLSDRMSTFLSKITTELLEMAAEARDANNAKSAFLSHMSHEIRTPINAILGMDEMILRESKEAGTLGYAESIRSAGNNLLGIVNDVLDFSRIEAGKMSIIPVEYELSSVINDLYNIVELRAVDKGLTVKLNIDPTLPSVLFGDEIRLKQIITNILTNAVKYTEKGSVTLTIKESAKAGKEDSSDLKKACPGDELPNRSIRLCVSVKDTGIGIKPEDMDKLFEEFGRVDEKRNRTIEGTGLGISITKELLYLMGSRLSVTSTYGVGSEFGFEIMQGVVNTEPVGDIKGKFRSVRPTVKKNKASFTAEDARILIVDDVRVNLTLIKNLLKNTKINIDTAESGEEALKMVKEHEYDLILLDHLMPNMDGPQTLKRMNEMEDNRSSGKPVISLTANALEGAREEYLATGYKDYLSKPINIKELEDMLIHYIPSEKINIIKE